MLHEFALQGILESHYPIPDSTDNKYKYFEREENQ